VKISVMVTGRSYHTADRLPDEITLPDGSTVDNALEVLSAKLADGGQFPPSCLIAVSGQHLGTLASHRPCELQEGDEITLIAPVAGG
jgi:molybdopterin converting factor small subunit